MHKLGLSIAAAVIIAGVLPASSEELSIKCPSGKMVQKIANTVPREWQKLEKVGTLVMSSVSLRNGTTILSCNYGPAGNLFQTMPKTYIGCAPALGGFLCVRQKPARPHDNVFSSGELTVRLGQMVDLDGARTDVTHREGDLWFMGGFGPFAIIESLDRSRFALIDDARRPFRQCREAKYDTVRIVVGRDVKPGGAVCIRTNRNKIGVVRINGYDRDTLTVNFRVWN